MNGTYLSLENIANFTCAILDAVTTKSARTRYSLLRSEIVVKRMFIA